MTIRIYFLIFTLISGILAIGITTQSVKAHESGEAHAHEEDISETQLRRQMRDLRNGKLQEDMEKRHRELMKQFIPETAREGEGETDEEGATQESDRVLIYRGKNKSDIGKRLWNRY